MQLGDDNMAVRGIFTYLEISIPDTLFGLRVDLMG
jgi:hypothetical protein